MGLFIKVLLGVFLNKRTPAHNLVQTVVFTPHIISSVSVAVIFMWLMDPKNGVLNLGLQALHLPTSNWYLSADSALMSVLIVAIWQSCGHGSLLAIAGLRSIPEYLYEAAKLDRSSPAKTFIKITIPMLSPTLLYMVVTTTASAFTSFDIIKMMTQGGPDNSTNLIAYYVYQQGIMFNQYGRSHGGGGDPAALYGNAVLHQFLCAGSQGSLSVKKGDDDMTAKTFIKRTVECILLAALFIIFVFPFYWTLITSVKSMWEAIQFPPTFWPEKFMWSNYAEVWRSSNFAHFGKNSVILSVGATIIQICSSVLAAYAFARNGVPVQEAAVCPEPGGYHDSGAGHLPAHFPDVLQVGQS